jgi:hypothetical protein
MSHSYTCSCSQNLTTPAPEERFRVELDLTRDQAHLLACILWEVTECPVWFMGGYSGNPERLTGRGKVLATGVYTELGKALGERFDDFYDSPEGTFEEAWKEE